MPTQTEWSRPHLSTFSRLALVLLLASALLAPQAWAQAQCDRFGCGRISCATPARPVDRALWGDLQPVDPNPLPTNRDATAFDEFKEQYASKNWYFALDVENGFLFTALSHGLQIWDLSNPATPNLLTQAKDSGTGSLLPVWSDSAEVKWPIQDIDVPSGSDNVAAAVGEGGIGLVVFDTSNKSKVRVAYQNNLKDGHDVHATTIGNTQYAFAATSSGLFGYNLTAARQLSGCLEGVPAVGQSVACAGVFLGRVGPRAEAKYVSGVDQFVAASFGASGRVGDRGFEIWDMSNPSSPQLKLSGITSEFVYGTAMWKEGNRYLIGLRTSSQGRIYDVSCITGTCSGSLTPQWTQTLDSGAENFFVTFSRSNGTPFLYWGSDNRCTGGLQREWLMDVSNPAAPHDITPPAKVFNGQTTGYWGWYYRPNTTGFNLVMPRMGKFNGDYFYRAGLAIMDIHKRTTASPPQVDFEFSPLEVYPGTPVNFTDRSTGSPFSWSWSFGNGSPASSTVQNPQAVTFTQPGQATVTLAATNSVGNGNRSKTVNVLDPNAQIGGITVSPASPIVCQPVTFSATATGRPPLAFSWQIKSDATNLPVPTPNNTGTSLVWDTAGITAGSYTATLTVSNGAGNPAVATKTITLGALGTLPGSNQFTPTNDPFSAGVVKFHVTAAGATEWNWDFGSGYTGWTNDPVAGPNPTHSYTTTGQRTVKVKVRNCLQAEQESAPLTINIAQVAPLNAAFQATGIFCSGFGCLVNTNQAISFVDTSTGAEFYDFDWNGDGDFTDATDQANVAANANVFVVTGGQRTISHTYTTAGDFTPRMRVRRGASEESVAIHRNITVSTGSGNPNPNPNPGGATISVSCSPGSVAIGASAACTASASGCNASTNGWTWSTGGGTVAGGSSSAIGVSWSSAGNKTVAASNSACGSASGNTSVTVTGGTNPNPNPGGPLAAQFVFTPSAPKPGEAVTFDAGSSSGSPVEYAWNWGDNTNGTGKTAAHTYAAVGTYTVRLTVTKPGTGSNCFFGICAAEITKVVVVASGTGGPGTTPINAEYGADVPCVNQFGFNQCEAQTGKTVTLTANLTGADSYSWSFGDNTTATGRTVTHTWASPGEYSVALTVTKGSSNASHTRTFLVTGAPVASVKSVVLPWIAQTRGALDQSSDLYVHNPGTAAMEVTLEFRKRGTPEANPPKVVRTIQPGATLYVADVLKELFNRENVAGFITLLVNGPVEPIITSFNTTVQTDGSQFGQTVPGISMSQATPKAGPQTQHLVGLNDTNDRLAYFGISNPSDTTSTYRVRFFDKLGQPLGQSGDLTVSRYGQRQFQVREIREQFGVTGEDDYRIEVSNQDGVQLFPYASNLRIASDDPSFVGVSSSPRYSKVYLLGTLSARGVNNTLWQTDVVLTNTTAQVVLADLKFLRVGNTGTPTEPVRVRLQAGETQRLSNVLASQWGVTDTLGVLIVESDSPLGIFPIVQGESYENTQPSKRFGQSMQAMSDQDAAGAGQGSFLVGLRQDAKNRTTLWLYNPSQAEADFDIVYRGLDGAVLGRMNGVKLAAGKMRQLSPSQHPIPAAGVTGGFTVHISVRSGKVLSAAQVVNSATNDPAYIEGKVR